MGKQKKIKKFPADIEILDFSKVDFTHPQKLYRGAVVVSGEGTMKVYNNRYEHREWKINF